MLHDDACGKISVLLKSLGTTLDGLSSGGVRRRRSEFGFNEVAHERPPRWYVRLLRAFNDPFIALLVALGTVAFLDAGPEGHLDHRRDGAHQRVAARFFQEYRSSTAAERLKAMVRNTATVVLATRNSTCFGSIARKLVGRRVMTSFDRGMSSFTWLMIYFILVMVPLVFVINGLTKGTGKEPSSSPWRWRWG